MVHTKPSRSIRTEAKSLSTQPDPVRRSSLHSTARHSGPHRPPRTKAERALQAIDAATVARRRKISSKDRQWLELFVLNGFKDPEQAATLAGFKERGIGYKLTQRMADLVDAERLRLQAAEQMEMDEALRVVANLARTCPDEKVKLAAARTIIQVHGGLSDRPLPPSDRRSLAREIEAMAGTLGMAVQRAGGKARIQAAIAIQAEISPELDAETASPIDIQPEKPIS